MTVPTDSIRQKNLRSVTDWPLVKVTFLQELDAFTGSKPRSHKRVALIIQFLFYRKMQMRADHLTSGAAKADMLAFFNPALFNQHTAFL